MTKQEIKNKNELRKCIERNITRKGIHAVTKYTELLYNTGYTVSDENKNLVTNGQHTIDVNKAIIHESLKMAKGETQ